MCHCCWTFSHTYKAILACYRGKQINQPASCSDCTHASTIHRRSIDSFTKASKKLVKLAASKVAATANSRKMVTRGLLRVMRSCKINCQKFLLIASYFLSSYNVACALIIVIHTFFSLQMGAVKWNNFYILSILDVSYNSKPRVFSSVMYSNVLPASWIFLSIDFAVFFLFSVGNDNASKKENHHSDDVA